MHHPLHVVHAVRSDAFAGVERYVATVAVELAARGHRVTVIGGDPSAMQTAIGRTDDAVTVVPAATTAAVVRALVRHGRGADVVHVHMTAAEVAAVASWPVVRAPVVATRHFAERRGTTTLGRAAAPLVRRRLAAQVAISRFVAAHLGEPAVVVPNGVPDADPVDPVQPVVLVAQRLEAEKRTGLALDAWAASDLADRGWTMVVAGDGAERAALERRAPVGVRFVGRRDDLPALRAEAGMLLATAPAEPFGLSVVEAMACGLPVVASAGGAHDETVGAAAPELLFPAGDVAACAALLTRLAGDVGLRRALGARLRAHQQAHLGIAGHVDRLLELYAEVQHR